VCPHALATEEEETHMKYVLATVICLVLISVTPALAAYCWAQAAQVHFSGRGEREAFIARCIADLMPTPPAKRRTYIEPIGRFGPCLTTKTA